MSQNRVVSSYENFTKKLVSHGFNLVEEHDGYKVMSVSFNNGQSFILAISPLRTEIRDAKTGNIVATYLCCIKSVKWLLKLLRNIIVTSVYYVEPDNVSEDMTEEQSESDSMSGEE